jgi:hypothetical protein
MTTGKSCRLSEITAYFFLLNLKYAKPDLDLRSPEMIEQYTQQAINLILAGVGFHPQQ